MELENKIGGTGSFSDTESCPMSAVMGGNLIWFICNFSLTSLRMGLVIISISMNLIISDQDQLRPRWFDY